MSFDQILQAINSVGFPIIAVIGVAWYAYDQGKENRKQVASLMEIVNNNTIAITKLTEKLGMGE